MPNARSGSRFKVVVPAARKPDTLQTQQRGAFQEAARAELEAAYAERLASAQGQRFSWQQVVGVREEPLW